MRVELRPYQSDVRDRIRAKFAAGHKKLMLCSPTGSGKTEIALNLMEGVSERNVDLRARGQKEKTAMFVCDRIALVQQTSRRAFDYGIEHGVAQGDSTFGRMQKIQICSAQTIEKRGYFPPADLIIIDEAHTQRKFITEYLKKNSSAYILGMSATPFTRGLADVYTGGVINACTTFDLLEQKWLVMPRVYACTPIDLTGLDKNSKGEWRDESVAKAANKIQGDIIKEWVKNTHKEFGRPVKTLLFGATVAWCEEICEKFQSLGYDFRTTSFHDDSEKTQKLISQFRDGEFIGLASVDKLTKGFDVPEVMCLITARPYNKSFAAWMQQVGRGFRPAEGKDKFLVDDHSGNWLGFYLDMIDFYENGATELASGKKNREPARREMREYEKPMCNECGIYLMPGQKHCPGCGAARPRRATGVTMMPGELELQEDIKKGSRTWKNNKRWVWRQMLLYAAESMRDYGTGEDKARKFALAQFKQMYGEWPDFRWGRAMPDDDDAFCDDRVRRAIRKQTKGYRQSQKKSWKPNPETERDAVRDMAKEYGEHIVYDSGRDARW